MNKVLRGTVSTQGRWPARGGDTYSYERDSAQNVDATFSLGNWEEDTNWDEEIGRLSNVTSEKRFVNQYGIS